MVSFVPGTLHETRSSREMEDVIHRDGPLSEGPSRDMPHTENDIGSSPSISNWPLTSKGDSRHKAELGSKRGGALPRPAAAL